jgi:CheY-like chemotaxis protein
MNSKISILIADDDTDDISLLVEGLGEVISNFEVITAGDGIECLRLLKNGCKPDVVFIDLNMPLKNGLECLRDITVDKLITNTPVIVYSTSQHSKDINMASAFGATFYMVKPTSFSTLKQLLKEVFIMLGKSKQEQQEKSNFVVKEQKLSAA